ncbi:MAG: hypothetical protein AAFV53_42500 [Myxococcota bacterium]
MASPIDQSLTVEWYRPVLLGRMIAIWLGGVMLIGFGMVSSAIAFDPTGRFPEMVQAVSLVAGVLATVSGALFGLIGILRVLAADPVWLLVRLDGLLYHTDHEERFIPWQGLRTARWADRRLILEEDDQEPLVIGYRFMGISGPDLARRIRELQRQALLGVLQQRTDRPPR